MRTASRFLTPCEALRQINDLCQSNSKKDKEIRYLLAKFEKMAKKLAREVNKRPGEKINDSWWEKIEIDFDNIVSWRISETYKQGNEKNSINIILYSWFSFFVCSRIIS